MIGPSDCHIPLAGGCNFRDLGGHRTGDGRTVRWRRLFRSGVLDRLTDADCAAVQQLGIATIVDLRTSGERKSRPSRSIAGAVTLSREYGSSDADHTRPLDHVPAEKLRQTMIRVYQAMPDEQAENYRTLFVALAQATAPVLFHCTGGKDRTGVAAAILLDLLGVSREAISADYELTNFCLGRDAAVIDAGGRRYPEPMRLASPEYLAAMFARLDRDFGGSSGYLRHLGLPDAIQPQLQSRFLV